MWCCGSDGYGLFLTTVAGLLWYSIAVWNPSAVTNPKCQHLQKCLVWQERAWMLSVLWEMLSSWLHQRRRLRCVIRLSVCLNWFSSSAVQVRDHQYIPSRQGVSVVYDRKKKKKNTINQTSSWEASHSWETWLSHPKRTFSPFLSCVFRCIPLMLLHEMVK